jgi:hypothetical protein
LEYNHLTTEESLFFQITEMQNFNVNEEKIKKEKRIENKRKIEEEKKEKEKENQKKEKEEKKEKQIKANDDERINLLNSIKRQRFYSYITMAMLSIILFYIHK